MSKKQQRLVTFPLDAIVNDLLKDYDCRTISPEVAEILNLVKNGQGEYHVQFPGENEVDIEGNLIDSPRLWSLRHWRSTSERTQRLHLKAQQEREMWLVKEGNIKLITRCLLKFAFLNADAARCLSMQMLDRGEHEKIRAIIGPGRKLYTNSKEIP